MKIAPMLLSACLAAGASAYAAPHETLSTASRVPGLSLRVLHAIPEQHEGRAPVLFIHGSSFPSELAAGFRMNGRSWMDVMAQHGFDTYALDFLGYGRSDRYAEMEPGGATPLGRARDVEANVDRAVDLIRQRTGHAKVTLIAHSWGGSVGALYAQRHPDKVAALVLFAAVTPRFAAQPTEPAKVTQAYTDMTPAQRIHLMDQLRPADQPPALAPEVFKDWGPQWLASDPLAAAHRRDAVRFPSGPDQDLADLLAGRSYYDPARITAPTLLIRGEWDSYPSASDYAWLHDHLTAAPVRKSVVVPAGTHVLHLEHSRNVLYREVVNFLISPDQRE